MPHVEGLAVGGAGRKADRDPLRGLWLDDRFLVEDRIANGGFGAVYRGRTKDGQPVALKVLHSWLASDEDIVARFRREGATLTKLHDRHTVRTLAVGETGDGLLYIAMELLTGESLHDRMRRTGALPWPDAVAIARAVASALTEAHHLGVIHRDLKPANIHLIAGATGGAAVKVIDFGIAKITRGSAVDDGRELTHAGHMVGTCDYMSPEQLTSNDCRAPSDIYALGLVLYEMLAGQRAFPQASGPIEMLATLLTQAAAPPSIHAVIPPALDRVVMRCIERDADARYPDVAQLIAALDAVTQPREDATLVSPVIVPATLADGDVAWPADADALDTIRPDDEDDAADVGVPDTIQPSNAIPGVRVAAAGPATLRDNDVDDRTPVDMPSPTGIFTTLQGVAAPRTPRADASVPGLVAAGKAGAATVPHSGAAPVLRSAVAARIQARRRVADPDIALDAPEPPRRPSQPLPPRTSGDDVAWIPPLPRGEAQVAPPVAPIARGSSSDLHAAATVASARTWATLGWLLLVVACVGVILFAALY